MPAMLPPRFMQPPRKPDRAREASMPGIAQYIPHQRRKKRVEESKITTVRGSLEIGDAEDRKAGDDRRDAEQRPEYRVRLAPARAPSVADLAPDQLADEPGEERGEQGAAELLDVEAVDHRQIGRDMQVRSP